MAKILNFDKFMSEKKKETVTVTIYGKKYQIPGEIPAIVPVMMARAEEAADSDAINVQLVMKAADHLFGKKAVDELCAKGMSAVELSQLVQMVFQTINGEDTDDEAEEYDDDTSKVEGPGKRTGKK